MFYVKSKSYHLKKLGVPMAFVLVKVNPFNFKLKANVTLSNGEEHEIINQWDSEEEFDRRIDSFVNSKFKSSY